MTLLTRLVQSAFQRLKDVILNWVYSRQRPLTQSTSPRLCEQDTLRLVQAAFRRVKGELLSFEHSHGVIDHKLSCDAIVVTPDYPTSAADEHPNEWVQLGVVHREVAELCFAVSCCAGFGFHENRDFWLKALPLDRTGAAILVVGDIRYAFPPIVFKWNRAQPGLWRLPNHLRGFFGLSSTVTTTQSDALSGSMELLAAFALPQRKTKVIHATLDLYSVIGDVPIQRVHAPVNEVVASLNTASDHPDGLRFKLHSIRLHEYALTFRWCQELMEQVAAEVEIVPKSNILYGLDSSVSTERRRSLQIMVGAFGTEWKERLRELEVGYTDDGCFASLCSLLPFSRSLETLSVRTARHTDVLWLGYAMSHPRAHETRWRTLNLHVRIASELVLMDLCAQTGGWLFALLATMASPTTTPAAICDQMVEAIAQGEDLHAKPATIRASTDSILLVARENGEQSLPLSQGDSDTVEVCDASWAAADSSRYVDVAVAGIGIGRIQASCLEMQQASVSSVAATSCISALRVSGMPFESANRLAWLLAPSLNHLDI